MIRASFNDDWQFRPKVNPFAELAGTAVPFEPVTVPHDAMITRDREATMDGAGSAYFPGGAYEYRKTFFAPEEHRGKRIVLEFEGVYRDATVFVNGNYAGQRPYGYSQFFIDVDRFLRFGANNEVRVECRTHQDSRWYSGAGIYRDTWLLVGEVVRISPDGVHRPRLRPGRSAGHGRKAGPVTTRSTPPRPQGRSRRAVSGQGEGYGSSYSFVRLHRCGGGRKVPMTSFGLHRGRAGRSGSERVPQVAVVLGGHLGDRDGPRHDSLRGRPGPERLRHADPDRALGRAGGRHRLRSSRRSTCTTTRLTASP
ncbi:hypothetical protein KLK06_18510 [Nonomuraea sp. NEAU-A123]|nr:hypothetical protein [Nonomuraea sp. NEAU-A123]